MENFMVRRKLLATREGAPGRLLTRCRLAAILLGAGLSKAGRTKAKYPDKPKTGYG